MDMLLLSKHEAAQMLGVSLRTLEYLISRGEITTRRIGRRVLISRTALEVFVSQISQGSSVVSEDKKQGRRSLPLQGDDQF
jgi:excisionase family DNA binding protein